MNGEMTEIENSEDDECDAGERTTNTEKTPLSTLEEQVNSLWSSFKDLLSLVEQRSTAILPELMFTNNESATVERVKQSTDPNEMAAGRALEALISSDSKGKACNR